MQQVNKSSVVSTTSLVTPTSDFTGLPLNIYFSPGSDTSTVGSGFGFGGLERDHATTLTSELVGSAVTSSLATTGAAVAVVSSLSSSTSFTSTLQPLAYVSERDDVVNTYAGSIVSVTVGKLQDMTCKFDVSSAKWSKFLMVHLGRGFNTRKLCI